MAIIPSNTFKIWRDGDVVKASEYMQELEILRMAINANGADISVLKNATVGVLKGVRYGATFPPNPEPGEVFLRTDEDMYYFLSSESTWTPLALNSDLLAHIDDTENPHKVSAAQIGAYTKTETDIKFAVKTQPAWRSPVYQNGWSDFPTAGYEVLSYMKDELGRVHIRGMCKNGSPTPTTIFALPTGYRPGKILVRSAMGKNTSGVETFVRVDINSDGSVVLKNAIGSDYLSINLSFDTR